MREIESIDIESLIERYGEDALDSLLAVFLQRMPLDLQKLKQAMSLRDKTELKHLIHALKGSCSVMFANQMKQNCVDLEEAVVRDDWDQASSLSEYLYGSFDELKSELQSPRTEMAQTDFSID